MNKNFPAADCKVIHRKRDYFMIGFAFMGVSLCFMMDSVARLNGQYILGIAGWFSLFCLLKGESKYIRIQVLIAVSFATLGEHFASIYMAGYTYRLHNVPAFVPPGHGIVYLTAVVLGRSGFFQHYARQIVLFVVLTGGFWSVFSLSGFIGRSDQIGFILFMIYLLYLFKGKSPMVYLGAFFITSWVEIVGTSLGTWNWAAIDPASTLTQGNPPSGVAAWYCLVDAVAIGGTPLVLGLMEKLSLFKKRVTQSSPR